MPNHVTNIIKLVGSKTKINQLLNDIKQDGLPIGTIDFNKIIPMPKTFDMLSDYWQNIAIDIYFSAINPDNENYFIEKFNIKEYKKLLNEVQPRLTCHKINDTISFETAVEKSKEFYAYITEKNDEVITDGEDIFLCGKIIIENIRLYHFKDSIHWAIYNWGTKWNAYDANEFDEETSSLQFRTAWSPAIPVIEELAKKYPEVEFYFRYADEDIGCNTGYAYYNRKTYPPSKKVHFTHRSEKSSRFAAKILGFNTKTLYLKNNLFVDMEFDFPLAFTHSDVQEFKDAGFDFSKFPNKFITETGDYVINDLSIKEKTLFLDEMVKCGIDVEYFLYH